MTPRIHKGWPTVAVGVGLILLFAGEHILSGFDSEARIVSGLGAIAIIAALAARLSEMGGDPLDARVRRLIAMCTAGVAVSVGLYALGEYVFDGDDAKRISGVLLVAWLMMLGLSLLPLLAMELAVLSVAHTPHYEIRRVNQAFERGVSLALLVSAAFLANFIADRHEFKKDFSTGKKAEATEQTLRMVRDLSKEVTVTLFYPKANDVADRLMEYFESLDGASAYMKVESVDQALAGKVASSAGVNENGYVVVTHEKTNEKIRVGLQLRSARSALRSFDANFAKALVKTTRSKSVAYFTVGHAERLVAPPSSDKRPPLKLLQQQLRSNQYEIKDLGIAEGLGSEIPADASIVFIMGPEKPFLPEEIATIQRAVQRGVRLLIALEADNDGDPLDEILGSLGLKFDRTLLANERAFVRVTGTTADRYHVFSNRYSSHASVTTMTRNATKIATLLSRSGSLEKIEPTPPGLRVDMVLNALDATFRDTNGNLEHDEGEAKDGFGLAAAVTRTSTGASDQSRIFVFADVDTFTDKYVKFSGNPYLFGDIVYWLRDVKEPVLPTVSEADVRIVHKRDEDAAWFYSTIFGGPAVVMLFGLWMGRKRGTRS